MARSTRTKRSKHRGNAAGIGDAARGDHRHGDGVDDLRNQREGADLGGDIIGEEHAAVAAGLSALGDDRVAAVCFQPPSFIDGRG